jgi:hypothetical protein
VKGRRFEVAQHGPGAGGQNRGHPAPARGQALVADGVDATMDTEQPPLLDPARNAAARVPKLRQLAPGHHAMLTLSERR